MDNLMGTASAQSSNLWGAANWECQGWEGPWGAQISSGESHWSRFPQHIPSNPGRTR